MLPKLRLVALGLIAWWGLHQDEAPAPARTRPSLYSDMPAPGCGGTPELAPEQRCLAKYTHERLHDVDTDLALAVGLWDCVAASE